MSLSQESIKDIYRGEAQLAKLFPKSEIIRSHEEFMEYASFVPNDEKELLSKKYRSVCLPEALKYTQYLKHSVRGYEEFRYLRVIFFSLLVNESRSLTENFTRDIIMDNYSARILSVLGKHAEDDAMVNNMLITSFLYYHAYCMFRLKRDYKNRSKMQPSQISKGLAELQLLAYSSLMELTLHRVSQKTQVESWKDLPDAISIKKEITSENARENVNKRWAARDKSAEELKRHINDMLGMSKKHHVIAEELLKMKTQVGHNLCSYEVSGVRREMQPNEVKKIVKQYLISIGRSDLIHGRR